MVESDAPKAVLDEILEVWFAELENVQGFDAATIEGLRRLAARGRLGRPAEIKKAIELGDRRAR